MAQTLVDIGSIKDRVTAEAINKLGEIVTTLGVSPTGTMAKYNTNSATSSITLTAGNITGGYEDVTLNLTGVLGAGAAATLPLVTDLVAAIPNAAAGQSYMLRIINSSGGAFTWTVTTNTGWTLNGTMTVAQNTWRDFIVTLTSLTAATLQNVGVGTFS